MAKLMLYSVYDAKVKYFHNPMFMRNKGEAIRSWQEAANDDKSQICRHPSDFDLFEMGEFDDQTGSIQMHKTPESIGLAVHFKTAPSQVSDLFSKTAN